MNTYSWDGVNRNDIEGLIIGSEFSLSSTLQLELAYDDKDRAGLEDEYFVKLMFVYPPKEGPTASDGISSDIWRENKDMTGEPVSYTHLRAHETRHDLVCRLLLEKKKTGGSQQ